MDIHKKDLLFYSNFCDYSTNLIHILNKKGIRDNFILICVDKKDIKIPSFIDCVPTILTPKKEKYTDEAILKYLELKTQKITNINEDISPFMFGQSLNSGQYTFLTSDGNGYDTSGDAFNSVQNNNFVILGHDQRITAPKENEDNKTNKFDSALLEKYMNARNSDDEFIKKKLNNNGIR